MNNAVSSSGAVNGGGGGLAPDSMVASLTPVALDPALRERMAQVEEERRRKDALRARVVKERRVLFPLLGVALLMLPNFGRAKVVGHSMEPQFNTGDSLILLKTYRYLSPIKAGDIVVLQKKEGRLEGEDLVKRVVFVQNDAGNAPWPETITNKRGTFKTSQLFPRESLGFVKVPPHHLYVMGDNVWNSVDSRDPDVGAVSENEIIGKVLNR
jgi:signal peptidase I